MDTDPNKRRPLLRFLPALLWAVVIFAGSSVPGTNIPGGYSVYGHLSEYAVLGALVAFAFRDRGLWRAVGIALLVCALYGASDEFHQAFVPYRTPDPLDWLTDVVGAGIGAGIWVVALRVRSRARAHTRERTAHASTRPDDQ